MTKKLILSLAGVFLAVALVAEGCSDKELSATNPNPVTPPVNYAELDLPATPFNYADQSADIPVYLADFIAKSPTALNEPGPIDNTPSTNPITNNGATLGRVLFYDKRLSFNNTISCASCHHQDKAFTDGKNFSDGFEGKLTKRNAMPVVNMRYFRAKKMFWDMRAGDLETQTLMPIQDLIEMGMPDMNAVVTKLKAVGYYPDLFNKAFGNNEVTADKISKAISQFLRSIISFNSKYDKGLSNNFSDFTAQELSGKAVMIKFNCTECHSDLSSSVTKANPTFLIVDNSGINTGVGSNNGLEEVYTDKGIGALTGKAQDQGTFKIPSLRNVVLTAPYMHDGRFATLEQVLDHYSTGVKKNPNLGIQLPNVGLRFSDQQKKDIIAFLNTLTDPTLATNKKYSNPFK